MRKDEKEYGKYAEAARDLMGEGGSGRASRKKGSLYSHENVKTGVVTSVGDTVRFLFGKKGKR